MKNKLMNVTLTTEQLLEIREMSDNCVEYSIINDRVLKLMEGSDKYKYGLYTYIMDYLHYMEGVLEDFVEDVSNHQERLKKKYN